MTHSGTGDQPAIEVRDLAKTYRGRPPVEALRGLSFEVREGEIFGLLGPNGAGKSTTVKILTTLSVPTGGSAKVFGIDVARRPRDVRRRIGCVAQASGVDIFATGRENIILQGRMHGMGSAEVTARASELLRLFRLDDAAERQVKTYSGGMKRRLDVAIGLVHRPRVLFLDEPTTGLDPESRANLWEEVGRLAREGLTILLTTHYLEEADQLAQRLAIVDKGKIVAEGTPDALKGALRGDLVKVELAARERSAEGTSILESLDGVVSVQIDGDKLLARVDHGARSIPGIVGALERAGLVVAEVSASRPSLDDVYLNATGHTFAEGEARSKAKAS